MDFRSKWLVHVLRTLLALLLLLMGGSGLYFVISGNAPTVPGTTEAINAALLGLTVSGLIVVAKIAEIIAALMLLINFRPAFANLLLAPVTVGIIVYDLVLWSHMPAAIIPAFFVLIVNVYLGYVYWPKYQAIIEK